MAEIDPMSMARGTLLEKAEKRIVLAVPGSDYRLHLIRAKPMNAEVGQRIRGVVTVHAHRIDRCDTGGTFIDPLLGEPRNVQGRILAIDPEAHTLLVKSAIPLVVKVRPPQQAKDFIEGDLINFFVSSGSSFEPVDAAPGSGSDHGPGEPTAATTTKSQPA